MASFRQLHTESASSGLWENVILTTIPTYHREQEYCKNSAKKLRGKLGCVGTPSIGVEEPYLQSDSITCDPYCVPPKHTRGSHAYVITW